MNLLDHYVYVKIYHKHIDFSTRRATYCRLVLVCCMQHVAQEETREELSTALVIPLSGLWGELLFLPGGEKKNDKN